jgi:hypothetical protein
LRGAADHNADRLVTLDEAYRFAFGETLASTESSTAGAQHAAYEIQLAGTGDLIMTDLRKTTAGLSLAPDVEGRVYVRDASGNLASELFKPPGVGGVELALEPGKYSIVVDDGGKLRKANVVLVDGKTTTLPASAFVGFTGESNTTHGAGSPEYRRIPFTMSLFPPASVNSIEKQRKVENNFAINWIVGHAARIRGIELGLGVNWVDEDVQGAQLGLAANLVGTELRGVQWSVGANIARGGLHGLQASAGVNIASTRRALDPRLQLHGGQLSPGLNLAHGDLRGAQLGVMSNVVTGALNGVQIGLVNVARGRVHGAQIGLVNYADDGDVSIGLVPISKKGGVAGVVWTDDIATINAGLRLNARRTYAILSLGVHPFPKRLGGHWNYGVTIGGRITLHPKVYLDLDVGYRGVVPGFREFTDMPNVALARALVGARLGRRLSVFAGPSFAVMVLPERADEGFRPGYQWQVADIRRGPVRMRMWPGFAAGLQF